eukprot:8882536-Lingulodinium_polyedra.AAC.1
MDPNDMKGLFMFAMQIPDPLHRLPKLQMLVTELEAWGRFRYDSTGKVLNHWDGNTKNSVDWETSDGIFGFVVPKNAKGDDRI